MDPQHHQLVHQKAHLVTLQLAHQHQVLDNLKYATKFFLKLMIYIQRFNSDSLVYLQSNPHKVGYHNTICYFQTKYFIAHPSARRVLISLEQSKEASMKCQSYID